MTVAEVLAFEVTRALGAPPPSPATGVVWDAIASGDPGDAGLDATAFSRTWQLNGSVQMALSPTRPEHLLVVSRSRPLAGRDRGIRVHRLRSDAPGVHVEPRPLLGDVAFAVRFEGAEVTDDDAVGPPRDASEALSRALDVASLAAVAEMLDAAESALHTAVDWVSTREQFGAPLAMRQAVQHRAADMAINCAAVRALLDDARRAERSGGPFAVEVVTAKLLASERLPDVTASAHQLHGGEGYYADRPLNEWHRRVLTLAGLFGNAAYQRRRLTQLLALRL